MRHVAVVGMYHSGATALAHIIGALPGAANVGDSRLIASDPQAAVCTLCGDDCAVLTPAFRDELRSDPIAWYAKLASHFAAEVLVSVERNVEALGARITDVDLVYCFRSPLAAYRSYQNAQPPRPLGVAEYLWRWANFYGQAHYEFPAARSKTWVDFSAWVQAPEAQLKALCTSLDLAFDPAALEYWRKPPHSIGAAKTDALLRERRFEALRLARRPAPEFSAAERACLDDHGPAQGMDHFMRGRAVA